MPCSLASHARGSLGLISAIGSLDESDADLFDRSLREELAKLSVAVAVIDLCSVSRIRRACLHRLVEVQRASEQAGRRIAMIMPRWMSAGPRLISGLRMQGLGAAADAEDAASLLGISSHEIRNLLDSRRAAAGSDAPAEPRRSLFTQVTEAARYWLAIPGSLFPRSAPRKPDAAPALAEGGSRSLAGQIAEAGKYWLGMIVRPFRKKA